MTKDSLIDTHMVILPVSKMPTETSPVQITPEAATDWLRFCYSMDTLCRKYNGLGLSAVQVGATDRIFPWKVFIVKSEKGVETIFNFDSIGYRYFFNCEYEPLSDEKSDVLEGCLSLPDRFFVVPRWKSVLVKGMELIKKDGTLGFHPFEKVMSNDTYNEIVFQHEIDHHNNVLISDIGKEVFVKPV